MGSISSEVDHSKRIVESMGTELLIEIGCEEIPARFLPVASQQLKQNIGEVLSVNSLGFDGIAAYSTPRRLIVHASHVADTQPARSQVVMGPPWAIAFDRDRRPYSGGLGICPQEPGRCGGSLSGNNEKGQLSGLPEASSRSASGPNSGGGDSQRHQGIGIAQEHEMGSEPLSVSSAHTLDPLPL